MPEVAEYELLLEALQFIAVLVLLYVNYSKSKLDKGKRLLFMAFIFYIAHLVPQIYNTILRIYGKHIFEIAAISSHVFETLFFMTFGYAIVNALVADPILHKINRTNLYVVLLFVLIFSIGMVFMEGVKLAFAHTHKELVYELVELTIQVLILNIIYHSWKDTQARHLLFTGAAFVLFIAGTTGHVYALLYETAPMELYSLLRSALYLPALILLAYTALYVER
jgi:hypothetical protein